MATSLVSKINTSVALVKGWVNSFLAFMGQLYIGFYIFALCPSGSATSHERGILFCTTFAHPISDELFNNLVAQFVGGENQPTMDSAGCALLSSAAGSRMKPLRVNEARKRSVK